MSNPQLGFYFGMGFVLTGAIVFIAEVLKRPYHQEVYRNDGRRTDDTLTRSLSEGLRRTDFTKDN